MTRAGQTYIDFNDSFFKDGMRSEKVKALTRSVAERVLAQATASAPVDTGAYRNGLEVDAVEHAHRTTYMVVGHDPKTMLVESRTQNLARSLRKVKI